MKLHEVFSAPEDLLDTLDNADRNAGQDKMYMDKQKVDRVASSKKNKERTKVDRIIARKKLNNAENNRKVNMDDNPEQPPHGTGLSL